MPDTPDTLDTSDPSETPAADPAAPGLSRRDFLRRAGKEAAVTGTRLVPGAALARTVLGVDTPSEEPGPDSGADNSRVPRWLRSLVSRRAAGGGAKPDAPSRKENK